MSFAFAGLYTDTITYPSGAAAASIPVTVYNAGSLVNSVYVPGTVLATLYTDRTKATVGPNPVTSSPLGNLSFYALPAEYDIFVAGSYAFTVLVGIDPADSVAGAQGASAGADLTGSTNTLVTSTHLSSPLPLVQGGTGSAVQNFVDLTANQTIAGIKTFTSPVGVPTPIGAGDAATKAYVDATPGLSVKTAARLATAAALPTNTYASNVLTATANAALTVDGVAVLVNDRIIVKNEAAQANNGIYTVTTVGDGSTKYVLTRATDANTGGALVGALILATAGNTLAGTQWSIQGSGPFTLGTTAIPFAQFGTSTGYTAGTGITIAGSVISVTPGSIPTANLPLTVSVDNQLSERSFADGVITGTNTLTSATAAFTSGDNGKTVVGTNFPVGTTLTFSSATVCTLSQACTNGSSQVCTIVQGVYALRNTVTTDATRRVIWRGALAPTAGGGYMTAGVDDYLSTA